MLYLLSIPTFSCFRCFNSFSSRYVRFDRTGVLNGFMIFFTATAWPVNWSFAELYNHRHIRTDLVVSPSLVREKE